jgi:rare lipoprotein A
MTVRGRRRWAGRLLWLAVIPAFAAGCSYFSSRPPAPAPAPPPPAALPTPSVVGVASWYGPGFDGHRTSNGEIYDQDELTAACKRFKLGTHVMVTNLDNGRSVEVRINDRGPFVKGRMIDLSYRAAKLLKIVHPGTARVRIDALGGPTRTVAASSDGLAYSVQVGAFNNRHNAEYVRRRLARQYADVRIEAVDAGAGHYYRVRMGKFATRAQAAERANDTGSIGYPMVIVSE